MLIAVGSTNPVKIRAVKRAFGQIWPQQKITVKGVKVDSGVSNQPKGSAETLKGAKTRAIQALKQLKADFGVGLEGGLEEVLGEWFTRGWCVVINRKKEIGIGASLSIHIPPKMLKLLVQGWELGLVDDFFTQRKNTKKKEGHFGIMTNSYLTRTKAYTEAVIAALARFINPHFYQ